MKLTTLYEVLHESIKKFSDHIALSQWQGEEITYSQVGERVAQLQETLVSAGLNPGDRVAILSSNMPNWGISYFAVTTAGYVAVPILPDFTTEDLDRIIEHSETKALLVSDKLFNKVSKTTTDKLNIVIRTKNLSIISQRVKEQGSTAIPKPEDLAAIIYTSGTTSSPKGVMLSHYNISAQTWLIEPLFRLKDDDVLLSVLPLSHTYECSLGLVYAFSAGCHMVYLDKAPTVSVLTAALKEVRPTIMIIVPLIIEKIYRARVLAKFTSNAFWRTIYKVGFMRRYLHRVAGKKLLKFFGGRIRFLGIGGAKLDTNAEKFLYEAKVPYAIGYGLTETAPLLAGAVGDMVRIGSTGPILKGIEARIENVNLETGQGEIVVKSPSQMMGYYKNEEATREVITSDGWFRTGDLGCFDEDGWLYIKGRLKNMIVGPSGENIYPEDIETVLNSHVFISESVVTEQEGHLVALVHFDKEAIEARYEELVDKWKQTKQEWERFKDETMAEIKEYVNARVNRNSRITEVVEEEEEFVKTPTKKIRRFLYNNRNKA
ncbi:MAG: AMP-binding protein [Alistipes sp.]|nr:AMP-binding protein [Alistipes sp.]